MISKLRRVFVIVVVFYGGSALSAAVVAHHMLDGTTWTDVKKEPAQAAPAPPPPRRSADVGRRSELVGTCAIPTTTGVIQSTCAVPGALRVVGTVRRDAASGRRPCRTTPFTRTVRTYGDHYLCLGRN